MSPASDEANIFLSFAFLVEMKLSIAYPISDPLLNRNVCFVTGSIGHEEATQETT